MSRARIFIIIGFVVALVAGLGALRLARRAGFSGPESEAGADGATRQKLSVGFLPVARHLTCPVTDYASKTSQSTRFESQRFTDFPTVADAIKSGRLDATFMAVPLAMKMREQGIPIKIVYLGHRDGSTVIVRKADPAQRLRDLRGKSFALPTRYSNQNLVIHKLMEQQGVRPDELDFVEVAPPDRVSYRMLTPPTRELQEIHDMALKAGLLERPVSMPELVDASFVPQEIKQAVIG